MQAPALPFSLALRPPTVCARPFIYLASSVGSLIYTGARDESRAGYLYLVVVALFFGRRRADEAAIFPCALAVLACSLVMCVLVFGSATVSDGIEVHAPGLSLLLNDS